MLEIFNQWRKQVRSRNLGLIEVRDVRQFCFHDLETKTCHIEWGNPPWRGED